MQNLIEFEIYEVKDEAKDTLGVTLKYTGEKQLEFEPGQFLTVLFDLDGEEIRRGYSIASSPYELPFVQLAIKRQSDGFASNHLMDQFTEGKRIKTLPPLGNFTVETNANHHKNYIMIGAGSGITPLASMIKTILRDEPNSKVFLIYGNRDEESIIYNKMFNDLFEEYPNFKIVHSLSNPSENWTGLKGRISKEKTVELVKSFINETEKGEYFVCGPEGMMENVFEALKELNVSKNQIHREVYTTKVVEDDESSEDISREVTIILEGKKHKITVNPDESILEKALAEGLEVPNSCQYGSCGTCKAKLLSGKLKLVDQSVLTEEEVNQGYCLTCVGYPLSDNVVILYEDRF